jgi:hypothetical protein
MFNGHKYYWAYKGGKWELETEKEMEADYVKYKQSHKKDHDKKDHDKKHHDHKHHEDDDKKHKYQDISDFFDILQGNKFTHEGRLFDWVLNRPVDESADDHHSSFTSIIGNNNILAAEVSVDFFLGMIAGNFPYFSSEVYSSDVMRLNLQPSLNLTTTWKVSILNSFKFEYEFEITPLLFTLGADLYSNSMLGDNCVMAYYNYETLRFDSRIKKNIKQCSFDFKRILVDPSTFGFGCEYDEIFGTDKQHLKFLSGSLSEFVPFAALRNALNKDDYVFFSYCLGSLDWARFITAPHTNVQTAREQF